ncbi:MAG: hypothetical protein ACM3MF_04335 [Anaerolineae bacterium]
MRRGFGRPLRRALAPDIPPLLRRANQMLAAGNYAEAASAYEQLARAAEARGGPRAPFFYMQAGRSQILGGRTSEGVEQVQRGLGLFAMRGQQFKAVNTGSRIIQELEARGLHREAKQVDDYLEELVPGFAEEDTPASKTASARRPLLPTHCPGCGAPLRPDEVEWLDEATAACEYCGSPVHGQ